MATRVEMSTPNEMRPVGRVVRNGQQRRLGRGQTKEKRRRRLDAADGEQTQCVSEMLTSLLAGRSFPHTSQLCDIGCGSPWRIREEYRLARPAKELKADPLAAKTSDRASPSPACEVDGTSLLRSKVGLPPPDQRVVSGSNVWMSQVCPQAVRRSARAMLQEWHHGRAKDSRTSQERVRRGFVPQDPECAMLRLCILPLRCR